MASSIVGALRVNLGIDSAKFTKGIKKSETELQKFGKKLAKIGAAVSAASAGIALGVQRNLSAVDEMGKLGQKIGVPIDELGRLAHAADMSGVKMGDLENAITRMSRNMVDTPDKFSELGIAIRDADGNMRAAQDVLNDVADELAGMPDGAEKTALAFDLMGRSGSALIPMLNGGAAGLKDMKAEADSLGIVFTEDTFRKAEQFNDNLSRLKKQFSGIGTVITTQLAPVLVTITNGMVSMSQWFRDLSPQMQKFIGVTAGIVAVLGPLATGLGLAAIAAGPLVAGIAALVGPVGLAVAAIAGLTAGAIYLYTEWDSLTERFPALQKALDTVMPALKGLGDAIMIIGDGAITHLKSAFGVVSSLLRGDFSGAFEHGKTMVNNLGDVLLGLAPLALNAIDAMSGGMLTGMGNLAISAGGWALDIVRAIINGLKGLYEAGVNAIADLGRGLSDQVTALKDTAKQWGSDIASGLGNGISSAASRVGDAGRNLIKRIKGDTEDEAEIKSPSRVFFRLGEFITQGLANGITAGQGMINGAITDLADGMGAIRASAEDAFAGFVTGAITAKQALSDVLSSLARVMANRAFAALFGGGGVLPIPGFATGTNYAPGGMAMVGERGPELVNLPRGSQVMNAHRTKDVMRGQAQEQVVRLMIEEGPGFATRVRAEAQGVAIETVRASSRAASDMKYLRGGR